MTQTSKIKSEDMDNIVLEVAKGLVDCLNEKNSIVFPKYHNDGKVENRISEQESKVLFTNEFINKKIRFAVEVPTKSKHSFSGPEGKKGRSARFDLAAYEGDTYDFEWVIELKAGTPRESSFQKDFEKMVKSESNCVWFHTLKSADENTYGVLSDKMSESIKSKITDFKGKHDWKIVIVVLEKKELHLLNITLEKDEYDEIKFREQLFNNKLSEKLREKTK